MNKTTGDSIGVIPNTTGVHSIAFVPSLGKGYTSNGRTNNVKVFNLKAASALYLKYGFKITTAYYHNPLPEVVYMEHLIFP